MTSTEQASGDRYATRAGTMFLEASEEEIVDAMKQVMPVGKRLDVDVWPNGAKAAVAITFDVDNEFPMPALQPSRIANGSYGWFQALPRLYKLFDEEEVPATFFLPVASALVAPQMVPDMLKSGRHEIALHGWTHERLLELNGREEEERLLHEQIDWYKRNVGGLPRGFRAVNGNMTVDTIELLSNAGLKYDSSAQGGDDCFELLHKGKPTGLVEIPFNWLLVEAMYLHIDEYYQGNMPMPEDVSKVFASEFEAAYEEGGVCMLLLHPHIIGHRSRIPILRRFIQDAKAKGDVWFATMKQIADYVATRNGLPSVAA